MSSVVLDTATRLLTPLLFGFSVFLLLAGHNAPGGGFAGGLVAASALALILIGRGAAAARRALRVRPEMLLGLGLLVSMTSGLAGVFAGRPFLSGVWVVPGLGTPLVFDAGVYLVVVGAAAMILFELGGE
jgi:multicomponent Na+:H+ antiporter subunit B